MRNRTASILFAVLVAAVIIVWYYTSYAPAHTAILINKVTYTCNGGKSIAAEFYAGSSPVPVPSGKPPTPTGYANVVLNTGESHTLNQTISADGARYGTADESFVFWSKGTQALIMRNNKMDMTYMNCHV